MKQLISLLNMLNQMTKKKKDQTAFLIFLPKLEIKCKAH